MVVNVIHLTHDRTRIHRGVFAKRDRYCGKLAAAAAIAFEITARDQGGARTRRGHAVNRVFAMTATSLARTFAVAAAAHHRPAQSRKADRRQTGDRARKTRVDDHRSPLDATCGEPAVRPGLVIRA